MQSVTIASFGGGITDKFIDCADDKYKRCDNLLITSDSKLRIRPGSKIFSEDYPQLPLGLSRVSLIFYFDETYFFGGAKNMYYFGTDYTELVGPSGNEAVSYGDEDGFFSHGIWDDTIILAYDDYTNNNFSRPTKMFKDDAGELQVRTAGLPVISGMTVTPAVAGTINVYTYKACYYYSYMVGTLEFRDYGPFTQVQVSIDTSDLSANAVTLANIPALLNGATAPQFNYDTGNTETGLDATVITMTSANPGVVTHASHGFSTGDATYYSTTGALPTAIVAGTIYYVIVVDNDSYKIALSYADAIAGTAIDTTAGAQSGVHSDYKVNIYIKLYRTQLNGSDYTLLATLGNGETSYVDTALDATISNNEGPYTTGGVLDNDPPPESKYVHIANSSAWYSHVKDGDEIYKNRVMQSIKDDIDSVPATSYIDLEDAQKGISSYLDRVVCFGEGKIYRLDGYLDELGGGLLTYQKIHGSAGCLSNLGIIQIPNGIVWAGVNGFYYTDGFNVRRLSKDLNKTYLKFTQEALQSKRFYGSYDAINNRVHWGIQSNIGDTDDCDIQFVLDLNAPLSDQSVFVTASNGNSFAPTSFVFVNGDMVRGDKRGYIFQHKDYYLSDPKIDDTKYIDEWGTDAIIWDFYSKAYSFGTLQYRKFSSRVVVDTLSESNLSLQVNSDNDLGKVISSLKPIRNRDAIVWGDPNIQWGDSSIIWNSKKLIEEQRMFKSNSLRYSYKQIQLTNANVSIVNSDLIGNATVSINEATLNDSTFAWPEDGIGYFLTFPNDDYENEYPITKISGLTVIFLDPYKKAATITEATEGVFTVAAHGRSNEDLVAFFTDGVLPNNIVVGTNYYVIKIDADNYKVADTLLNAQRKIGIDTTGGAESGNHYETSTINGSQEFVVKGYPKNEIFHLMSYTIYYDVLGQTQTTFSSEGVGNNAD